MAKISLRMYNREIEGLVEQGQRLDEAIAHCRHILQTYPKHLETYRLLGKAYLEAKRYDQAVDIFQRVLVAAPEDFVSHVGMSIIADDKSRLDDAIWHMERAFEVQPSNAAIQGELQRLFGRRDGIEPPKIRLTRGALAHMYVQGELYNQAISEIRAVLAGDPKRSDMQTLLARAYFRNGQKPEAADICGELLGRYPYSLDANRLMAEMAPGTSRPDVVQEYRQRVIELDPYAAFATESLVQADNVSDNLVTVERLEYTGEAAEMPPSLGIGLDTDATVMSRAASAAPAAPTVSNDLPAWLQTGGEAAGLATPSQAATPSDQNDIPDFLRKAGWGATSGESAEQGAPAFEEQRGAAGGEAAVEGELPEWVKALAPAAEDMTPSEPEPPSQPAEPFQSVSSGLGEAAAGEAPDWLRELGEPEAKPPEVAKPGSPLPASETPSVPPLPADAPDWLRGLGPAPTESAPATAQVPDDTPDWLKDLGGRELDEPAAPTRNENEADWLSSLRTEEEAPAASAQPVQDETPDWLKDFGNDLETPIAKAPIPPAAEPAAPPPAKTEMPGALGSLGTTAQEQDDAMAWLESLAAKHGAKPEELVTDPNARTDIAPEWVDKAKEIGEQPTAAPTPPADMDETGMWLRGLAAEGERTKAPEPAPQEPAAEVFDFRSTFADQADFAETEPEAAKEELPPQAESETPAWLQDLAETPAERHGLEDAPGWLRGLEEVERPATPSEAEIPTQPIPATELPSAEDTGNELPAWLAGLEKEEAGATLPLPERMPSEELPAWLHSEAEPEPEAKEPANPADWRPVAAPEPAPMEARLEEIEPEPQAVEEEPPVVEHKPEPVQPAPPLPVEIQVEKPPVEVHVQQPPATMPVPERVEKKREPIPARPKPAAPAPKPAAATLGDAQAQLGRGNIAAALDIYTRLIRKGKSLEDIIRDLRDALYRYPVEVPLWQSLGDAYMRANRLQEALDAYTKAEELLR